MFLRNLFTAGRQALDDTVGERPTLLRAILAISLLDAVQLTYFTFAADKLRVLTAVSFVGTLALALALLWHGSKAARGGLTAFHLVMAAPAPLAVMAGLVKPGDLPSFIFGTALSALLAVLLWLPALNQWLLAVALRRAELPRDSRQGLLGVGAAFGAFRLLVTFLTPKGFLGQGVPLSALLLANAHIGLIGLIVLVVQGMKALRLK